MCKTLSKHQEEAIQFTVSEELVQFLAEHGCHIWGGGGTEKIGFHIDNEVRC